MTQDDDPFLRALADLPPIAPDVEWEGRVRMRCHSAISGRASRRAQAGGDPFSAKFIKLAAVAVLCVYWAAVLVEAARLRGSI